MDGDTLQVDLVTHGSANQDFGSSGLKLIRAGALVMGHHIMFINWRRKLPRAPHFENSQSSPGPSLGISQALLRGGGFLFTHKATSTVLFEESLSSVRPSPGVERTELNTRGAASVWVPGAAPAPLVPETELWAQAGGRLVVERYLDARTYLSSARKLEPRRAERRVHSPCVKKRQPGDRRDLEPTCSGSMKDLVELPEGKGEGEQSRYQDPPSEGELRTSWWANDMNNYLIHILSNTHWPRNLD
ncbi:hypothetical protein FB451DRAFT_1195324 [Mycena latifolia]|nr:hypothetical protein FB451DRAFT_1195324 [Mycena latifolia]